jgi:LuxR family transcriptional regulator, activator of conjugal transfer of Ti plasmids
MTDLTDAFVLSFLDEARESTNIQMLKQSMQTTMEAIGLSRWAYAAKAEIIHNYPSDWVDYYISRKYMEIDPIVTRGCSLNAPFRWSEIAPLYDLSTEERNYYGEAMDFGLIDGLGVPILGGSNHVVFSMASDERITKIDRRLKNDRLQFIALAYAFHSIYERISQSKPACDKPLSPREAECLLWTARGKTSAEIASRLNISERTVIFHIENSKRKLKVKNRSQAAVKAIAIGFIQP